MEAIKNNDYILYKGSIGKVETLIGDTVIANIDGKKVKDKIHNFKKWHRDKIHKISKENFIITTDKILNTDYLANKYPNLSKSDIEMILTSGALLFSLLKDELFKNRTTPEVNDE